MKQQNPTLKKAMIKALEQSLGVVTTAAKIAGIDRSTHYEWLKTDEDYNDHLSSAENITGVAAFGDEGFYKHRR
jgi:hypothetical protein